MATAKARARGLAMCSLLAVPCLPVATAWAQQRQPAAVFTDAVDVRVVNVEAVVTDRRGRRVRNLEAEDFELLVDGEPAPISFFTEVAGGRAKAVAEGGMRGVPGLSPGAPVGVNVLIFIDDAFSIERDRNRVLDSLGNDLSLHFGPADRVAVVAFDGANMETLTPWTNSLHDLDEALHLARRRTAHGLRRAAERLASEADREAQREVVATGRAAGESGGRQTGTARQRARRVAQEREYFQAGIDEKSEALDMLMSPLERTYADGLTSRLERSALAAVAALRSHAGRPGRKAMLLLSGGWPVSPAHFAVARGAERTRAVAGAADSLTSADNELYGRLTEAANLMGYTLYPVDVAGFDPRYRDSPSEEDRQLWTLDPVTRVELGENPRGSRTLPGAVEREPLLHETLDRLASATGGLPMIDAQRDGALARAFEDAGSFYWLGFEPRRREDDRRHGVEVRLSGRPDLEVRAREGYVDMSRDREFEMAVEAALLFGAPRAARPLGVRFGEPARAGRGRMAVPVELVIPLDEILLAPIGGEWRSALELRVTLVDAAGNRSAMPGQTIVIAGPRPPRPGEAYLYETGLVLRRKEHRYVLAVFDPLTGAILTSTGSIEP